MPLLDASDPRAIARAAETLADGGLVAFPTETVYGLGARADRDDAVAAIFAAKGRPADHPLIVHVADAAAADVFAASVPRAARRLMAQFWPGPLTIIVPRAPGMATAAAGGQGSIGLRCPSHPAAHALLAEAARLGVPGVAAPSANRFGRVSPTTASHVVEEFGDELLVLDGGACPVGIESAIVDCSRSGAPPSLLRPGVLSREALESWLGEPLSGRDAQSPRASGTLAAHYAPAARVRLFGTEALVAAVAALPPGGPASGLAVYSRLALAVPPGVAWRRMPDDAAGAATELFAALRGFDAAGATLLWIEAPPPGAAWDGVRDRLERAAAAG